MTQARSAVVFFWSISPGKKNSFPFQVTGLNESQPEAWIQMA